MSHLITVSLLLEKPIKIVEPLGSYLSMYQLLLVSPQVFK